MAPWNRPSLNTAFLDLTTLVKWLLLPGSQDASTAVLPLTRTPQGSKAISGLQETKYTKERVLIKHLLCVLIYPLALGLWATS